MKFLIKIAVLLSVLAVAALIAAVLFLGNIVRSGVETAGPAVTKVPVNLGNASVSLFNGSGTLKDFVLSNPEGFKTSEAIRVGSVELKMVPSSIMDDKVIVRSIRVENPEITYEAALSGSNLSKILENVRSAAGDSSSESGKTALQVDEFVITGGKIRLGATLLGSTTTEFALPEIRLANLGQGPEGITAAELSARALGAVLDGTVAAVAKNATSAGRQMLEGAMESGGSTLEGVKKLGTGVSELFKKQ